MSDWLIDFNGLSTRPRLFYAKKFRASFHLIIGSGTVNFPWVNCPINFLLDWRKHWYKSRGILNALKLQNVPPLTHCSSFMTVNQEDLRMNSPIKVTWEPICKFLFSLSPSFLLLQCTIIILKFFLLSHVYFYFINFKGWLWQFLRNYYPLILLSRLLLLLLRLSVTFLLTFYSIIPWYYYYHYYWDHHSFIYHFIQIIIPWYNNCY